MGVVDVGMAQTGKDGWKEGEREGKGRGREGRRWEERLHPVEKGLKVIKELLGK